MIAIERRAITIEALAATTVEETAVVPAVVYAELLGGVLLAKSPRRAADRRAKINALVASAPIVDFTREIGEHWAELFAALQKKGRMIPSNDLIVAATARAIGFGVLVGPSDERHFRTVPGLKIEVLA